MLKKPLAMLASRLWRRTGSKAKSKAKNATMPTTAPTIANGHWVSISSTKPCTKSPHENLAISKLSKHLL